MNELLSQVDCELRMFHGGIKRAETMMSKAEEKGRAVTNPYAKEILDTYVLPLSEALRVDLGTASAGAARAHIALLKMLDVDAVAVLAVRAAINGIMKEGSESHRALGYEIGKTVHNELVLTQIEQVNPELYHTLAMDFGRRLSKDERHRMTVFKMQAAKAGIPIIEWPAGSRDQVGLYILGLLESSGMVDVDETVLVKAKTGGKLKSPRTVTLSADLIQRIDQIKSYIAITMPVYGPCVEAPKDWVTQFDGGFHTRELRRTHPTLVRHRQARHAIYKDAQMPVVLAAVNALQRTRWAVNVQMLDTVLEVAKFFSVGEVTSLADKPKPDAPDWLTDADTKEVREAWPEDRKLQFKKWKRTMAEWYTQRKLNATKYGRFYSASRAAEMFREYPAIHFVYFADSRGRLYPMTYGLNPQGSDLQKALLRFAEGKPVDTPDAIKWFHVQGANKWGFDKATLEERQQWVVDRQDLLLTFAADPVNNDGWRQASKPLQFLAWCFEYKAWVEDNSGTFVSHLPISMDGSCNGLQNLSALFRDEVGGTATNLTNNDVMQDIYGQVAEKTTARLEAAKYDDEVLEALRIKWLSHGVSRSVVKRSVMTTPYGVTKSSATDYVVEDYLKDSGVTHPFEATEFSKAARVLMDHAWPSIGDVVVKGRLAMDWLKASAKAIVKKLDPDDPVISWVSPSGFPALQAYFETEVHRISTRLHGLSKIRVLTETDDADGNRHANGLAPNFVHSMDAAHLHLTTWQCALQSIDALAMIHDDYGTHAADSQKLYNIIREQFVAMYEQHDPVADFVSRYPYIKCPPEKGSLDIREVLKSRYFFS